MICDLQLGFNIHDLDLDVGIKFDHVYGTIAIHLGFIVSPKRSFLLLFLIVLSLMNLKLGGLESDKVVDSC